MNTPARVKVVATIVALEALLLISLSVLELTHLHADRASVAVTTAVFFFLYAAVLGWVAFALSRLHPWTRGPVVLTQLIALGVAWSFRGNQTTEVALGVGVPAVLALALVLSPPTTRALYPRSE